MSDAVIMEAANRLRIVSCAMAAHEVNRIYCLALNDTSQLAWKDAPKWQKDSAIRGVQGAIDGNTPEQAHVSWLKEKAHAGWVYGAVKDPVARTHPCMRPYSELPPEQRAKDELYLSVVKAMHKALTSP